MAKDTSASRSDKPQRSSKAPAVDRAEETTEAKPDLTASATTSPDASTQGRPKRRREDLFLGDTELFAFDFGGAATVVTSTQDEEANQAGARNQIKSKELEEVTARLTASTEASSRQRVPLTLEHVTQCAAAARESPLTQFFFFPGPRKAKRTTDTLAVGTAPRLEREEVATLTEAHTYFENGLRKYDEALWRAHKAKREEEKAKRKRQRQRTTN